MNLHLFAFSLSKAISKRRLIHFYQQKQTSNQYLENNLEKKLDYYSLLHSSAHQLKSKGLLRKDRVYKGVYEGADNLLKTAENILQKCSKKNISIVTIEDKNYPSLLRQIYDPPIILYYKGILPAFEIEEKNKWGIVGTRKSDNFIDDYVHHFSEQIVTNGGNVISGMALGIDTSAHQGAITAMKKSNCLGTTVSVLANGVDIIYPYQNKKLYYEILEYGGCILSEQKIGESPSKYSFPLRNRIIAGLCNQIFLAKAPQKSGAIITVRAGLEMGKTIYTYLPKEYSEDYQGNFFYIEQGASIINTKDKKKSCNSIDLKNQYEKLILDFLNEQEFPIGIDQIALQIKEINIVKITQMLFSLQLRGLIKQLPTKKYYSVSFCEIR